MSQSLERALDLLDAIRTTPGSLDELAARLQIHKSTVLRLLRSLEGRGFVEHDDAHRYRLGTKVFELATDALAVRPVLGVARPQLQRLNASTGHTIHLAVLEGSEAVYLDKVDATGPIRMYSRVGLRAPLHCTAVGKVLVAGSPRKDQILEGYTFTRFTDQTILTADAFDTELQGVATRGWAKDFGEHEPTMNCVGAPVRDGLGATVAAISISVPEFVARRSEVEALVPRLLETASAISRELGAA